MGKAGKREHVQVLRLLETFDLEVLQRLFLQRCRWLRKSARIWRSRRMSAVTM